MQAPDLNKLLSGKFIFTVVTALVFAYATYKRLLTNEQIQGVIMLVVGAYFFRKVEEPK